MDASEPVMCSECLLPTARECEFCFLPGAVCDGCAREGGQESFCCVEQRDQWDDTEAEPAGS